MIILKMARRANAAGVTPTVVLEQNNVQRALRVGIIEAASRHGVMVRVTLSVTSGPNKWDDETGLEQSVIDFENGWIEIPGQYPNDLAKFKGFVDSMTAYGMSAYIDVPIAYWKARQWLFEHRGALSGTTEIIHINARTPGRVQKRMRRLGTLNGLVIRDAYGYQEVENDGQRVG